MRDIGAAGRDRGASPGNSDYIQREDSPLYFAPAGSGSSAGHSEMIPPSISIAFSRTATFLAASCLIKIGVASASLVSSTSRIFPSAA